MAAVTPEQADKLNDLEVAEVARLESQINLFLMDNFELEGNAPVEFGIKGEIPSPRIARRISRIYTEAGWEVVTKSPNDRVWTFRKKVK